MDHNDCASDRAVSQLLKRKRLRFREEDDLALLRVVLSLNPFQNGNLWEDIQEHMFILTGKNFSVKTLRDHLLLIIKLWLEKNKFFKDKSGIEETYSERDQLCLSVHQIMIENAKENCFGKKNKPVNLGKSNREKYAQDSYELLKQNMPSTSHQDSLVEIDLPTENISENRMEVDVQAIRVDHSYGKYFEADIVSNEVEVSTDSNTKLQSQNEAKKTGKSASEKKKVLERVRSRVRKTSSQRQGLEYLTKFDREQNEFKKTELELAKERLELDREKLVVENRRLDLEERKLSLQEFERRKYIEIFEKKSESEKKERDDLIKIIERQEALINVILSKKINE